MKMLKKCRYLKFNTRNTLTEKMFDDCKRDDQHFCHNTNEP